MRFLDRIGRSGWVVATFSCVLGCGSSDPKPGNPPRRGSEYRGRTQEQR